MINKIISNGTLKDVSIVLKYLNEDEILQKTRDNYSIKNLNINFENNNIFSNNSIINNLEKKFPNLISLYFHENSRNYVNNNNEIIEQIIEINDNIYCNIEDFQIDFNRRNLKFNISFEKLKGFKYNEEWEHNKVSFRFGKNDYIFKSLTEFQGKFKSVSYLESINNIFNNKDKVPNLRSFEISGFINEEINKDFYIKFIEKLLDLNNLEKIVIKIKICLHNENNETKDYKFNCYSEKEIKDLFPNLNYQKYKTIFIDNLNFPILYDFDEELLNDIY